MQSFDFCIKKAVLVVLTSDTPNPRNKGKLHNAHQKTTYIFCYDDDKDVV